MTRNQLIKKYLGNQINQKRIKKKGGDKMPRVLRWIIYLSITTFIWRLFTTIDVNLLIQGLYKFLGINI